MTRHHEPKPSNRPRARATSSPHRCTPPSVFVHDHDRRQVSWLTGRRLAPPSRLPSGLDGVRLAAYSCGGSRGIGTSPSPRSLLIPEGNRRAESYTAMLRCVNAAGPSACVPKVDSRHDRPQTTPWSEGPSSLRVKRECGERPCRSRPQLSPQLYAVSRTPSKPLGNREGGVRQRSASQETGRRTISSATGGVPRRDSEPSFAGAVVAPML